MGASSSHGAAPGAFLRLGRVSLSFLAMTAVVALVCACLVFLRLAVLPAVFGLLLTALLSPFARLLRRAKIPRPVASAFALLLAVATVGGLGALFGVSVAGEFADLKDSVAAGYRSLLAWVANLASMPEEELKHVVQHHVEQVRDRLASFNAKTFTRVATAVQGLTIAGLAVVFAWFFTWDGDEQFEGIVALLPGRHQKHVRAAGARIWTTLSGYVRGVLLVASADALLLGIGLWIIGVPLVLPLMLLMFLAALVPFLGPLIAGTMAGLVGLAEGGISLGAMAIGISLLVQQIEGNLLQPFIMSRAVKLHPALVLTALTIGGLLGGITGVFLAVPVAASLKTAFLYLHEQTNSSRD